MTSIRELFQDHAVADPFESRHIGPRDSDLAVMLKVVGYDSLEALAAAAIPTAIQSFDRLSLPAAASEPEVLAELRQLADRNQLATQMIGLGYYDTFTPPVIQRNILESPAWYTAYTPYQPEISQGRLEALLNFQTMVCDLTGLHVAGASLLDEGTAAGEAMTLCRRSSKSTSNVFVLDADALPQTIAVVATRAEAMGYELQTWRAGTPLPAQFFGLLLQYPGASGAVRDLTSEIATAHEAGALVAVAADLLALSLLKPPGEMGADIACGTSQRFGVPLGFGGPHAGYLSVRTGLERQLPGRLVGVSIDADGAPAYRLALATREQHIRREKATSNICTAQVLLAVIASMYAVYHGPDGLKRIAAGVHRSAARLAAALQAMGLEVQDDAFFDTIRVRVPGRGTEVLTGAIHRGINVLKVDEDTIGISCDEKTTDAHLEALIETFASVSGQTEVGLGAGIPAIPAELERTTEFLTHPVFHTHRSETQMLRYLRSLADLDYALDRGMIPLGSCTMKLNATTEMAAITWPEFGGLHPFVPSAQSEGYRTLIHQLESYLVEITGYDAVSLQPNAGSQGELAGLLAVHAFHAANGESHRNVCLIPASAHGTNAASAAMAGMKVVVVATSDTGDVDMADLSAKVAAHARDLAVLMITYPSTHGVYEDTIGEICALVHDTGGQVYVDGANLNALVGLSKPGKFGADVSHLNLHKTFCIPHGGGGPGVGPVAVRSHLAPYLPNHPLVAEAGPASGVGPISAAPWGSASILPISWSYIRLMGPDGLKRATQVAILAANYVAKILDPHFPVLYTGADGLVAHECILDLRAITKRSGITVDDVAKRLIDYGFHAPTMSFPVAGTLMVEPTESEDMGELDRFCDAMIAIKSEIDAVAAGVWPADDNPLVHAPHTAAMVAGEWSHPYPAALAAFPGRGDLASPAGQVAARKKYWPPVRRIDGAHGDRNLMCSCPPLDSY